MFSFSSTFTIPTEDFRTVRSRLFTPRALATLVFFVALELALKDAVLHGLMGLHDWQVAVMARWYHTLVVFGTRQVPPKFTTVIQIQRHSPEAGLCQARHQLQQVIRRLSDFSPRAVVADITLQKIGAECPHGEPAALLSTI